MISLLLGLSASVCQWLSDLSGHQNHLAGLLKHKLLPLEFLMHWVWWNLRTDVADKCPGAAAVLGNTL